MNILVTHGYLLKGTGSNLYVCNLVREYCKAGHDVILVCQDYNPIDQDFINEVYKFNEANTEYVLTDQQETGFKGKCSRSISLWPSGLSGSLRWSEVYRIDPPD